jgi:uncharacterized hydrophobic protein (TIGR00271 family)
MSNQDPSSALPKLATSRDLLRLFNLRRDQAEPEVIDAAIRDAARLGGTNLWVLMAAVAIASVGLNVNSTAVIIGAMLISPLMGPIIGVGYGVAVHDGALVRQSSVNLAVFVALSLTASTAYFAISPLTQAHSELLARTSPNVWDVLIAFFGGAAGMIGLTRKEKTTLIPGVAIATALMPPLCTAGYGIASGQPTFFLGAFYLFLINGVFIALATLAVAKVVRLPLRAVPDPSVQRRGRVVIAVIAVAMLVPSAYLALRLVRDEAFSAGAERFVRSGVEGRDDVTLLSREIDVRRRQLTLTLIAPSGMAALQAELERRWAEAGPRDARLVIRHPSDARPDLAGLRRDLQKDLLSGALSATEAQAARITALEAQVASLEAAVRGPTEDLLQLEREIRAQLPEARHVVVTGNRREASAAGPGRTVVVMIDHRRGLATAEKARLNRWLKERLPDADVQLNLSTAEP